MNIPEEFGKYLLLKKLVEDPLGETFRAGKAGQEGMEQVVLLRVLNGKGIDGEKLWTRISGRAGLQALLKSPNIGNGVDLGRVRSFPYTAYDYISGKNLASVFQQSARQHSPIPTDHALLIAERISLALAAAYESRFLDERVTHGFVVPQLVMISNEGETRLLGFEVAPGLRELAAGGWQEESLRPYLAPEALTGSSPSRADDVYSLGAILYEMLIGERLPAAATTGDFDALIDRAELPNEGTPLPGPVAALLKKSLAPRDQRIADAVTWHKTLSKLMIDGHFSPTTFNLAFFMHNLFRDEIERESQEMQAEKKLELPKRPPAPVAAPVAVAAAANAAGQGTGGVREGTLSGTLSGTRSQAAPESSKKGMWIGIAAVLALALLGGGGYFLFGRSSGTQTAATATPAATPVPLSTPAPGTTPAMDPAAKAAAEAQLQAQIQQMFEARSKEMEAKFKTQYDDRIKLLQKQLEDTRKGGGSGGGQVAAVPEKPAETRSVTRSEPPPVVPAPVPEKPAVAAPQPAPAPVQEKPAPAPVQEKPTAPAPAPAPRQAQVQVGDLVQPGPGVKGPKLMAKLDPRYPPAAQHLNRAAQVNLKVLVDERGRVMDAEGLGAKAGFGFDEAALDAARRASFQAATKDGVKVKMWMTLQVNFSPPVR